MTSPGRTRGAGGLPEPIAVVRHTGGTYPIFVTPGAFASLEAHARTAFGPRPVAVIADRAVADRIPAGFPAVVVVAGGEATKTRAVWADVSDRLLAGGLGRDGALVAVGGGATLDLAGFVAATLARGIPILHAPTTLLAMVDAAIGGKAAINTPHGKNLIGAFHPPAAVVADPLVLNTLPDRDFRCGLAEAVKHGAIADRDYFAQIDDASSALRARDLAATVAVVERSARIKAAVVEADERESGLRETLNAGHTMGHAIESLSNFTIPHGEAVAIGLVLECRLGETLGITRPGTAADVARLLASLGLPTDFPAGLAAVPEPERWLDVMRHDKKAREGAIRFALPAEIGVPARAGAEYSTPVADEPLRTFFAAL